MQEKIEKVLASLPKDRREKAMTAFNYRPEFLETPSLGMNFALGGGLPFGRTSTFWGTKSAGKSSLCLQIIANAQKEDKSCLYIDVEGTYDDSWAQRLGVDSESLLLDESRDVGSVTNAAKDYMAAGIDVVVVDSVSAMTPTAQIEEDGSLKDYEENNSMAANAREIKKFMNAVNYVNDNTLVILIAHGSMGPAGAIWKFKMQGGHALEFYSSQVIKLMSNNTSDVKAKQITSGDRVFEHPGYREVKYKVEYNKLGPQGMEGKYEFHFSGDYVGIDPYQELVRIAVEYGHVHKSGSWFSWGDNKLQGEQNVAQFLRENNEEFNHLRKLVENEQ